MMNHTPSVWIGVDLGTTGVRAVAYDLQGRSYANQQAFYPLLTPREGYAEENPRQILDATCSVIKKAVEELRYQGITVAGLALSTVMHSFIALNAQHEPLTNLITWADSRSAGIVHEMKDDTSACQQIYRRTGCPLHASYPLAKILWMRQERPQLYQQMQYVGSIKDYLFLHLTGQWRIDHSTASTSGFYNESEMQWDQDILAMLGLTAAQLPEIVSTTYRTSLSSEAAAKLDLPPGTPIVIGATDGVLVNIGIGAVKPGQLSATIGTSGALRMLTNAPTVDEKMRTWCYNLTDNLWVAGGAINNGGMILRWLRDKVCHYTKAHLENLDVDGYDLMTMKASHIPPGSNGLLMLPFFTGERAPYWNSDLRGMLFGLNLNHSRSHMIRATMEGICFNLRTVLRVLQSFHAVQDIRISGSFTKSELWIQILSDILGEKLTLPNVSEGAAFGAAVLGFKADGQIPDIADVASWIQPQKTYTPIAEHQAIYDELYAIYEKLYWNCQETFADIVAFQNRYNKK